MEQEAKQSPLKRISLEEGRFSANGKEYFIEGSLTIERYAQFQILEKELAYGLTTKGMYDELNQLLKLMNKLMFVDCAIRLNNLVRGVSKLEEREPVVLKICALYCNTADENRAVITDDMISQKIQDWKKEGLDMRDFFGLASSSVNGFQEIYRNVIQSISEKEG